MAAPVQRPDSWCQEQRGELVACVHMVPVPKLRARGKRGQGGYTPKRSSDAAELLAGYFQQCRGLFGVGPVHVYIQVREAQYRGDGDNHEKQVLDALQQAGVFTNDRQVRSCSWHIVACAAAEEGYYVQVRPYE